MNSAAKTNAKQDWCADCGGRVEAGEGNLWWEAGPDDGGDVVGGTPEGWRVTHADKAVCAASRAAAVEAAAKAKADELAEAAAKRAKIDAQLDAQRAEMARRIPSDWTDTGYTWSPTGVLRPELKKDWQGREYRDYSGHEVSHVNVQGYLGHETWREHVTLDGRAVYTVAFGNACILHAPVDVVEAAWSAWLKGHPTTVDESRDFLDEFGPRPHPDPLRARGCAGHQFHAWHLRSQGITYVSPDWVDVVAPDGTIAEPCVSPAKAAELLAKSRLGRTRIPEGSRAVPVAPRGQ